MSVQFEEHALEHYTYWAMHDRKILKKVNDLIKDIQRNPYEGIGKPEPLKHQYRGYWSRRIDDEHRLIYRVDDNIIYIMQCRFHY